MNEMLLLRLNRIQRTGIGVGLMALGVCGIGAIFNVRQFFISYLVACLFWLGLSLGCLAVAMIHHLTGGRWGDVTHRFFEAGYLTIPWIVILFVPLFFGLHELYPWARPAEVAASEILRHKSRYLNIHGFIFRAVFFFVIWIWISRLLRKWSRQQDVTFDASPTRRARAFSGPGVVIYSLTVTFAWLDWVMSLEADWYSTIFPIIICIGQILAAFALSIILLAWFKDYPPFSDLIDAGHFNQLGNLLLTFVMFWTYVCFGQLLIIWSGNLPHEISWYLHRIAGHWKWIVGFLVLFNFFLPFFLLLFRSSKRQPRILALLASIVLVSHAVDSFWLVEPSFYRAGLHIHWMDFAAPFGVGGVWVAGFVASLKHAGLLIKNDPRALPTLLPMHNDDVNLKGIVAFLCILALTLTLAYGALGLMTSHLEAKARRADQQAARTAPAPSLQASRPYFPYPREQPAPKADLEALRAREELELNSYGWIDKNAGVVRIPIARAMDLMVQRQERHP